MRKSFFKWAGKAIGAGLFAFVLLSLFCALYYNVPVHHANPDGATEYKWEAGKFYSRGTEGFALGRINNDGFNNLRDYTPGEAIDILLMGSSHMEGFNVAQDENAAALLNERFGTARYVYNIGTAGHDLLYCIKNLDRALMVYAPSSWVVMDTVSLDFEPSDMNLVVDGNYPGIPSRSGGLLTILQEFPVLRLFYTKYVKYGILFIGAQNDLSEKNTAMPDAYENSLERLLDKLVEASKMHGVRPMIVFSPPLLIAPDGRAYTETDPQELAVFNRLCADKGIEFVDLTETYLDAYSRRILPFGFSNTAPLAGHLNRQGHRLFADAVAARIAEREG